MHAAESDEYPEEQECKGNFFQVTIRFVTGWQIFFM
jgi:hypothetical protein